MRGFISKRLEAGSASRIVIIITLALVFFFSTGPFSTARALSESDLQNIFEALIIGRAQDLIVEFDDGEVQALKDSVAARTASGRDTGSILASRAEAYRKIKERVLSALPRRGWSLLNDYENLPMIFMRASVFEVLRLLLSDSRVVGIYENRAYFPSLAQSLPLAGQPESAASGYKGDGATVAVLDTGVDYTKAAFGGCSQPGDGCTVVVAKDFTREDDGELDDHGHGTNVAGIVAAVAPEASIAALDVFDGENAYASDIIDAIDWCVENAELHNIRAMNLSLGDGSRNRDLCTSNVFATPISNARNAGILAAIAAGNEGYTDAISSPACVPGAVRVGATYDSDMGALGWSSCMDWETGAKKVTCFSNSAGFLSLFAPGAIIDAAGYSMAGTSQAAPHAAGAIAVLGSAFPEESADTIEMRLIAGGDIITDHRNGVRKPFLNLYKSVDMDSDGASEAGDATVNNQWETVSFISNQLTNPVVIVGPPTYHGGNPGVVRLRNVSPSGFDLRFQEWDYRLRNHNDDYHVYEDMSYLAMDPGIRLMDDGSIWEAGTFTLDGTGEWKSVNFIQTFQGTPSLFLTVQTYNGYQAVTARARDVSTSGFKAAFFEEEALMNGHYQETVGYLAVYSPGKGGRVSIGGQDIPYALQKVVLDERFTPVLSSFLKAEEEASANSETGHVDETVDVLALGKHFFAQTVTYNGGDTMALRRLAPEYHSKMEWGVVHGLNHEWAWIPLSNSYSSPVVVSKPVSSDGSHPGPIRLKDVTSDSFQVRYQEWDYMDGWHTTETAFYLVAESGEELDLGGLKIEAGSLPSSKLLSDGWQTITFSNLFTKFPAVFTNVQTYNDDDPVTTRVHNLNAYGFDLTMDEEEALREGGHAQETLGWIAMERGNGTTVDGRDISVFTSSVDEREKTVAFPNVGRRYPVVVADVISTYGGDPVCLRYKGVDSNSIDLYLEEEASSNEETNHVMEDVSLFVAE